MKGKLKVKLVARTLAMINLDLDETNIEQWDKTRHGRLSRIEEVKLRSKSRRRSQPIPKSRNLLCQWLF